MKAVHIGFPKTGTTFLQKKLFPRLPREVTYVPESAPFFDALIRCDETVFDASGTERRLARACGENGRFLFSYEPLTGEPFRGFVNRTIIANRLRQLGFDRIIITIRNQFDLIESAYKEYVRNGGLLRFEEYLCFDGATRQSLSPEYFAYYPIYKLYCDLFGRPNVLLLQYENLGTAAFLEALSAFLQVGPITGVDFTMTVNPSLSSSKTRALRIINHLIVPAQLMTKRLSASAFHRRLAKVPAFNGSRPFLDAPTREAIANFYRESNERLRKEAGIALASGYP